MPVFDAAVLGIVQGLTEFLPVSSSGHLVIARILFGVSDVEGNLFDAFLHLGTLAAVLIYFRQVWVGIARGLIRNDVEGQDKRELAAKLAIATVPAAVAGYFFQDSLGAVFRAPRIVAVGLLITAAVLLAAHLWARKSSSIRRAGYGDALMIGLAQIAALVPGISRSGITIAAGQGRGLSRKQATAFSFLMSAPIIAGAGLAGLNSLLDAGRISWPILVLGFAMSFVSGLGAISFLLRIIERVSWLPFVVYVVFVAVLLFYAG